MDNTLKIEAIIFDFDGTLAELTIDFEFMKRKIAALAAAFMGDHPEPGSTPALEWIEELAEDIQEWEGKELAMEFRSRARLVINATELDAARQGNLFAFTEELLGSLRDAGVQTGIITRNSTAAVKIVFPEVEQHCGMFLAREDAQAVKPNPLHLTQVLDVFGVRPERALMVGDHAMDILTGKRAGSQTAGVFSGNVDEAGLREADPDYLAADAAELIRTLRAQGRM